MHTLLVLGLLLQGSLGLIPVSQVDIPGEIKNILGGNKESNSKCLQHIAEVVSGVSNMELWALQMIDASSKIPSGILKGNIQDMGNFDECINVWQNTTSGVIRGKHCTLGSSSSGSSSLSASLMITSVIPLMWSACVPESCKDTELNGLLSQLADTVNFEVPLQFNDSSCQTIDSTPDITTGDIITMAFFAILLAIVAFSTIYDIILLYAEKKPAHPTFIAFSVVTNGKKLITVTNSPSQLLCLNGIRSISMMWVVLAHMYTSTVMFGTMNVLDAFMFMMTPDSMFLVGATVSVDTFFLIGGLVLTYVFMNTMDKENKFNLPMYYFHRWLRLTPLLAAIILFHVTLLKFFSAGPLNMVNEMQISVCRDWWWTTLLYVQNYVNPGSQCMGVAWYLAVDMQLFILSPLILLPLRKWPQRTIGTIVFLCFMVSAGVFVTAWEFGLVGIMIAGTPETQAANQKYYYGQTHTRAAVWLIGVILGYYIYYFKKTKKPIKLNKAVVIFLWASSLCVLATCVFCGHDLIDKVDDRWINSIYIMLVRPSWALGLSWVIFACIFGLGGPVDWFLSLPVFQVLSKFTFSMYLVHSTLQLLVMANRRTSEYFTNFNLFFDFWGYFMLSLAIGCICTLLFESPIIVLEKFIFSKGGSPKKEAQDKESLDNAQENGDNKQSNQDDHITVSVNKY